MNALSQNFNSLGVALGSVVSLSSYNRYDNPILVDTLAVSFISVVSSMLVGLFAFATIGNIAHELNTTVEDVISDGERIGRHAGLLRSVGSGQRGEALPTTASYTASPHLSRTPTPCSACCTRARETEIERRRQCSESPVRRTGGQVAAHGMPQCSVSQ